MKTRVASTAWPPSDPLISAFMVKLRLIVVTYALTVEHELSMLHVGRLRQIDGSQCFISHGCTYS